MLLRAQRAFGPPQIGRGVLAVSAAAVVLPSPLVIVTHGNSVVRGEGATSGHQPSDRVASLRGMTVGVNVFNEAVNGQDIDYYISNFAGQVGTHLVGTADAAHRIQNRCWVVIGETLDYVDDTLGSAGSGLSISNPSAAGTADYNKLVTYATAAKNAGWMVAVICMPDAVEPAAYAGAPTGATDNTQYRTARDASYALVRADTTNFDRVVDCRARSEFSNPWSLTYYQNEGDGQRIHLTDAGYDLEGDVIHAALPS